MKAYLFWYKCDEYARTEYIYIFAFTAKQARYFFIKNGYTHMYDYETTPVDEIDALNFTMRHECGEIRGELARI